MASNINPNNIDSTYPVAGVDNDSQGFRTNFTSIKNNFTNAKTELEDLQSKVVLKSGLTINGSSLNNAMSGAIISGAEISDFRETEYDLGTSTLNQIISVDHSFGHFQKLILGAANCSLTFASLPAINKVGRIRLKVTVNNIVNNKITLPAAVTNGTATLEGYSSNVITFSGTGTFIYEFVTDDNGTTFHINDLSRPRVPTATSTTWGNSAIATFDRFTYSNVSTGFTAFAVNTLLIDSSSTLSSGTIYLPGAPTDGQKVSIVTNNAVTTLTLTANVGLVLGKVTSLKANSHVSYQYVAGPSKWFLLNIGNI
jgi:hypothetical protein